MSYQPYASTWVNPYLPINGPSSALGQSMIPAQQAQLANGWQQPMNGIIKVNGPDSAMQCNLPPNSTSYPMFDMNGKVFYVVSTDGNGSKTMETFSFAPFVEEQKAQQITDVISRHEFDELVAKVEAMSNGTYGPVHTTSATAASGEPAV